MNLLNAKNTTTRQNATPARNCSDKPIRSETIPMTVPATWHVREEPRAYFFSVLREVWPELLVEIKRELFPAYLKWAENFSASRPPGFAAAPRSFLEMERVAPEMAAAVLAWCSKHHLAGRDRRRTRVAWYRLGECCSHGQPLAGHGRCRDTLGLVSAEPRFALAEFEPTGLAPQKHLAWPCGRAANARGADSGKGRIPYYRGVRAASDKGLRASLTRRLKATRVVL
jgi:hypothetical protein